MDVDPGQAGLELLYLADGFGVVVDDEGRLQGVFLDELGELLLLRGGQFAGVGAAQEIDAVTAGEGGGE